MELQNIGHEVEIFTSAVYEECYPDFLKKLTVNVILHPLAGKLSPDWAPRIASSTARQRRLKEVEELPHLREWMGKIMGRQYYTSELPSMLNLGRRIPKGFDIINNHNFPTEWAAFFAKKRLKVPVVWMCNEPPYWFFVPEFRKGLRKINWPLFEVLDRVTVSYIDEIVVLSRIGAGYVRKAYNRSARVVRTGVDTELFHNASGEDVRKIHGLESSFVLLYVGRSAYAQQSSVIRALYRLSKDYDNVNLILDGPGQRDPLISLSEKLRVRDKVLFLHSKSDEELARVYAACDVFVYPSSISPWGLVVTEAMATAKAVVVSKQVGTSEIIQSGVNGIVVDHATPEEIAKQVKMLMNNPKLRKKLGENAYEYVKNNLSWEKYAKNMESIFQQTISNFKRNL
jgi:glycosyltransferase involved in cell wall biosynthesis